MTSLAVNKYVVYNLLKQKIKSCNTKRRRQREREKNRTESIRKLVISILNRSTIGQQELLNVHFLYISLTWLLHDNNVELLRFNPGAIRRNIVGQQFTTRLDVTCCVRLHTLLHVVGSCCVVRETGQSFEPTMILLFRDRGSEALYCWIRLRGFILVQSHLD